MNRCQDFPTLQTGCLICRINRQGAHEIGLFICLVKKYYILHNQSNFCLHVCFLIWQKLITSEALPDMGCMGCCCDPLISITPVVSLSGDALGRNNCREDPGHAGGLPSSSWPWSSWRILLRKRTRGGLPYHPFATVTPIRTSN